MRSSNQSTIALHFNSPPHNLTHLKCILIEHAFPTTQSGKQAETKWILKLRTHVRGLNADIGILRYYKYFTYAAAVNNNTDKDPLNEQHSFEKGCLTSPKIYENK